ncbi:hypothetical protein H0H93_002620 [Arthromyces matolae]|nr:hypothetical protein H0H93_002620 [Arthromyces matolae]
MTTAFIHPRFRNNNFLAQTWYTEALTECQVLTDILSQDSPVWDLACLLSKEEVKTTPPVSKDIYSLFRAQMIGQPTPSVPPLNLLDARYKVFMAYRVIDVYLFCIGSPPRTEIQQAVATVTELSKTTLEPLNDLSSLVDKTRHGLSNHFDDLMKETQNLELSTQLSGSSLTGMQQLYLALLIQKRKKGVMNSYINLTSSSVHLGCLLEGHLFLPTETKKLEKIIFGKKHNSTVDKTASKGRANSLHNALYLALSVSPLALLLPKEHTIVGSREGILGAWSQLGAVERPAPIVSAEKIMWKLIFNSPKAGDIRRELEQTLSSIEGFISEGTPRWINTIKPLQILPVPDNAEDVPDDTEDVMDDTPSSSTFVAMSSPSGIIEEPTKDVPSPLSSITDISNDQPANDTIVTDGLPHASDETDSDEDSGRNVEDKGAPPSGDETESDHNLVPGKPANPRRSSRKTTTLVHSADEIESEDDFVPGVEDKPAGRRRLSRNTAKADVLTKDTNIDDDSCSDADADATEETDSDDEPVVKPKKPRRKGPLPPKKPRRKGPLPPKKPARNKSVELIDLIDLTMDESDTALSDPALDLNKIGDSTNGSRKVKIKLQSGIMEYLPSFHLKYDIMWFYSMYEAAMSPKARPSAVANITTDKYNSMTTADFGDLFTHNSAIVVHDMNHVDIGFTAESLAKYCRLDWETTLHEFTVPYSSKTSRGCPADLLVANNPDAHRALSALHLPASRDHYPTLPFSTDIMAWNAVNGLEGCNHYDLYPIPDMRWAIASSGNSRHYWHVDSNGLSTIVSVETGLKLWFIARPKADSPASFYDVEMFTAQFDLHKVNDAIWDIELVVLEPGSTLIMRPHVPHAVITPSACIAQGGHFYFTPTLFDSIVGIYHHYVASRYITNTDHDSASRHLLIRILMLYHLYITTPGDNLARDYSHIPNLTSWDNVLTLFTFCAYFELSSALINWNYAKNNDVAGFRSSIFNRMKARDLIQWFFENHSLTSPTGDVLTGEAALNATYTTLLAQHARTLINLKTISMEARIHNDGEKITSKQVRDYVLDCINGGPAAALFHASASIVDATSFQWSGPVFAIAEISPIEIEFPHMHGIVGGDHKIAPLLGYKLDNWANMMEAKGI